MKNIKLLFTNKITRLFVLFFVCLTAINCGKTESPSPSEPAPVVQNTFTNPLINGADPSVYQKDGFYYYTHTTGTNIRIWKTKALTTLAATTPQTIYTPSSGAQNSQNVWAPELFFLQGKWYMYYTAGNGIDESQRTWVLENNNTDPTQGTWLDKGKLYSPDANFWAIDGTVMQYNNQLYFMWCGRPYLGGPADLTQNIYISKMASPTQLQGPVTRLTTPEFSWEKNGFAVNEGPEIYKNPDNKYYLIYSASYCGTDDYALGMLTLKSGGNPLTLADWDKSPQPVFTKSPANNAFAPGHNSFFKSADGKEDWIIYHANSNTNQGCADKRNIRMQKFTLNQDGSPKLGQPVATGLSIAKPSGE